MAQVAVRLPADEIAALDELAAAWRVDRSALLRVAVRDLLRKQDSGRARAAAEREVRP